VHDEEWSIMLNVEKVVLGKYSKNQVYIGTHNSKDTTFEKGKEYYITIDEGHHGTLLMGHQEIK
jgi:hypothetical protein